MERSDGIEISPHCQRCGSTNTKFCYYNNYSLTQPRYFCKGCRRYWTKGGSLRNVPVGGGCRKNSRRGSCISISRYHRKSPSKPPLGYSSINTSCVTGNSSSSSAPNIDLAQVYANFLKQEPEPAKNLPKDRPEDSIFEAREARTRPVSVLESQWEDYNRDPARPFESPDEEGLLFSHTADWFGSELAAPAAHTLQDDFGQACHDINQLVDGWSPFDFPI